MGMEEALVARLTGAAPIAAIAADRVGWFGRQRDDIGGQISLMLVSPGQEWNHDGPDGLERPRVRFDLWSPDPDEVITLARTTKIEMSNAAVVSGWRFHPAMLAAARTIDEGEQDGGAPLFHIQQEYLFYHEEFM